MLKAVPVDSRERNFLYWLEKYGPPYLFSANEFHPVGTVFSLGDHPFVITRDDVTLEEFRDRQIAREGLTAEQIRRSCEASFFFEATTD